MNLSHDLICDYQTNLSMVLEDGEFLIMNCFLKKAI